MAAALEITPGNDSLAVDAGLTRPPENASCRLSWTESRDPMVRTGDVDPTVTLPESATARLIFAGRLVLRDKATGIDSHCGDGTDAAIAFIIAPEPANGEACKKCWWVDKDKGSVG